MVSTKARVAIEHFLGSFFVVTILGFLSIYNNLTDLHVNIFILLTTAFVITTLIFMLFDGEILEIALRAAFLGYVCGLGFYLNLTCPLNVQIFGKYMCVMALFHFSEFLSIAIIQPNKLSVDSFIINHSPQYTIAAISSWIEYFVECYFFPDLKNLLWISNFGLLLCICGEILRKCAMLTAGNNFNHLVQCEKSKDHILVTKGIYAWSRHPSYVGWFYWSIGTQILLLNPICLIGYTIASWSFFKSRIYIEEITLLNFFGQNYVNYQKKVGTGLPFIYGYKIK